MKMDAPLNFECKTSIDSEALIAAGFSKGCSTSQLPLVGSIDQGTSSTRFLVFTKLGSICASAQMEHTQIFPDDHAEEGWHEHYPSEIWQNVVTCIRNVVRALKSSDFRIDLESNGLKSIGITNQRETTIAWNATTGKPYYNAIVWDDLRTTHIASKIARGDKDRLREKNWFAHRFLLRGHKGAVALR